jgi:sphinganine-1-phosphate aldolase
VYTSQKEHWDFIGEVMRETIETNPLHVMEFTNIGQMEAEVLKITLNLFNAPNEGCGVCTAGGTESILISMLAYR